MNDLAIVVNSKGIEMPTLNNQLELVVPLGKYSAFNTLTVNTMGSTFKAYYQLYTLNQSASNALQYAYPT